MFKINSATLHKVCILLKNIYDTPDYICRTENGKFSFLFLKPNEMTRLNTDIDIIDSKKIKDIDYKIDINKLSTFAKASGNKEIQFKTLANKLILEIDRAKVEFKAAESVNSQILQLNNPEGVEIGFIDFNSIAKRVVRILESSRFGLFSNSKLIIKDNIMSVYATDDFSVLIGTIPLETEVKQQDILIHLNTWSLLEKLTTDTDTSIKLQHDKAYYSLIADTNLYSISFTRQLVTDKFPDLTNLVPKTFQFHMQFPIEEWDTVSPFLKASKPGGTITVTYTDNKLTLTTDDDIEVSILNVENLSSDTGQKTIRLKYFVSAIELVRSSLTDKVMIGQASPKGPLLFQDTKSDTMYKVLVAPIV